MMIKNVSMMNRILSIGLLLCFISFIHSSRAFAGSATLSWNAPTTHTDGTPFTDLAGYKLYYGTSSGNYSTAVSLNSTATTTQVNNLTDGLTYYFAVTAYDSSGIESTYSNEVSKSLPAGAQYVLTTSKAGTGTGTITSSPAGISCGTTCTGTYGAGTAVTLTAAPNVNSIFSGWSGACTGTGACSVTIDAAKTVTATFLLKSYAITPSAGTGGSISPASAVTVTSGLNQTFTITPGSGYRVSSVLVDGVSVGAVTTYTFTNVTASHTISATFAMNTYTLTPSAGTGGAISPAGAATVNSGSNQTFTITPGSGYHVSSVLVDGVSVGAVTTYTFTNVIANHTISATFALNTYTITPSAGAGGAISPAGAATVYSGSNQTFTITPNAGYGIANVLVDGVSVGAIATYTFTNVTASHTVSATFALNSFTITPAAGSGGTISPATAVSVSSGSNQSFTITPSTGYSISSVLVDGVSVGAASTYTFSTVTANHTITANFVNNSYTITASVSGSGGSIFPSSTLTVPAGGNGAFTISPNTGYHTTDVLVDNKSIGPVSSYTFTSIAANHTIVANFAINTYTVSATSAGGGTISPLGSTSVNYGGNATFSIAPNAGNAISDVLVDGKSVGAVSTYGFSNITASHTISATFVTNVANGISCSDAGIPCIERVDGQPDGNNLVSGLPKVDVQFDFRAFVIDNGGNPQYVRLAMSPRSNPVAADYAMYDMNCTGNFSTGALCTFRTDLGAAASHRFYIEARLSNGSIVTYPQSGSIVGPKIALLNGYNLVGMPEDIRSVMLDGTSAFGTTPTYRWISGGLSANPGNGRYELVDAANPPVKPGEGYFAKRSTTQTLPVMDTYTNILDATYTVTLKLGWNLISNPYSGNVRLADIQVKRGIDAPVLWLQAASNKWLSNAIYYFTGSDWGNTYAFRSAGGTPDAMLIPWRAYWIYINKADATYSLIINKP
jgi:hypothetical protein